MKKSEYKKKHIGGFEYNECCQKGPMKKIARRIIRRNENLELANLHY